MSEKSPTQEPKSLFGRPKRAIATPRPHRRLAPGGKVVEDERGSRMWLLKVQIGNSGSMHVAAAVLIAAQNYAT